MLKKKMKIVPITSLHVHCGSIVKLAHFEIVIEAHFSQRSLSTVSFDCNEGEICKGTFGRCGVVF